MKKVAYFSNQFASSNGHGIARYASHLFNELSKFKKDLKIIPLATGSNKNIDELIKFKSETGLKILPGGTKVTPILWKYLDFPKIEKLAKIDFDLIHASSPGYPIATNKPYVVTIHDIGPLTHPHFFTKKDQWLMKKAIKQAIDKAKLLICVSQATAEALENYAIKTYNVTVKERIKVIYEGVSKDFFEKPNLEDCKDFKKNEDLLKKPFILCVGKISPRKNVQSVFEAFSKIHNHIPDYQLITVGGDGWDFKNTRDKAIELNIEDKVHFLGYVSDTMLNFLYHKATVFIYPSLFEGFGLTILEAMAANCPVITSNITSMPEIAGNAAVLIDPLNIIEMSKAIEKVCIDKRFQQELKIKGRERAKYFSWERCGKETLEIYNSL